jgi:hypothetical protein
MTEAKPKEPEGFPVPADNPAGDRYAVYDTQAGRYVDGSVTHVKADADKAATGKGHLHVVKV